MDSKPRTVPRPVACLVILLIIQKNRVQRQLNTTSLVTANPIPVQMFAIQTVLAQPASHNQRHVPAMELPGYWLQDMKYSIIHPLWKRVMYQWRPLMILLNWNSSSLTALASLNSSSWDMFGMDQCGILEQKGLHTAPPSSGVRRLLDKALESLEQVLRMRLW